MIDNLSEPVVDLDIDKGYYFSFIVDSIDKYQADMNIMDNWAKGGAEDLKVKVDNEILAYIPGAIASSNKGIAAGVETSKYNLGTTGSAVAITTSNAMRQFTNLKTVLDESNVPKEDRWVVIPPWYENALQNSDLKNASFSGLDKSLILRGFIGEISGFKIFVSNNLTSVSDTDTCWNIVAGHKCALTFASQIIISRTMTDAKVLGEIVQQVQVYGRELIKTDGAAVLYCKDNT